MRYVKIINRHLRDKCDNSHQSCFKCNIRASTARIRVSRNGQVYECDPFGVRQARARPAMGYFSHEAAVVDPETSIVHMTEDQEDGGLYRFVSDVGRSLSSGTLEVMVDVGGAIGREWIPDPRGRPTETRFQAPNTKVFNRGEGAFFSEGRLVVATTGDDRVLSYTPATET